MRSRVLAHFSGDLRAAKEMRISQEVKRVEWMETAGELGALLNEARLIKELLPTLNRTERRASGFFGFEWNGDMDSDAPLQLVASGRSETLRLENLFGTFRTKRLAQDALTAIATEQGLCPAILGLEAKRHKGSACFAHQIQRCRGACCGKETLRAHNLRLIAAMQSLRLAQWPWRGAIGVREKRGERCDVHLFDRWCFLGSATSEAEVFEKLEVRGEPLFDLDIYKIMQKFLATKKKPDIIEFGAMSSLWYRDEAASAA
jgi:DNA polymerase-3 subunit epsilon